MKNNDTDYKFVGFTDNDIITDIIENNGYTDNADVLMCDSTYTYAPTGDSLCWLCTIKHLGVAHEYASEVQRYPHHFIKCVGALVAASRECPSNECRKHICDFYNQCINTNTVTDMNDLLKLVYDRYVENMQ